MQAPGNNSPRKWKRWTAICCLGLLAMNTGMAKTIYVSLDGHHVSPYATWHDAATNVTPQATTAAADGDTIIVSNGNYTIFPSGNGMSLNKGVVVSGFYGAASTVFNGGNSTYSGIYMTGAKTVTVYGVTITNFSASGVSVSDHTGINAILDSCVIAGNNSGAWTTGGGIRHTAGKLWVTNCTISGNVATRVGSYAGGGVYSYNSSLFRCDNSFIINNSAPTGYGGGFFFGSQTNWAIRNCIISGNLSSNSGGGICDSFNIAGEPRLLANCTIVSNATLAGAGGGVDLGPNVIIENCLIAYNTVGGSSRGGGARLAGSAIMRNCTVVSNVSSYQAGGINGSAGTRVLNSIVYFNRTPGAYSNYLDAAEPSYWTNCCTAPDPAVYSKGTACTASDPEFTDASGGGFRPSRRSPCVNSGLNDPSWMGTALDLDRRRRIIEGTVDMGAFESVPSATIFSFN